MADMTIPDPFREDDPERLEFRVRSRTETTAAGPAVVVDVRGEVDLSTAGELEAAVAAALADRPTALVVDLTDVTFLDSAGLGVLAHGHVNRAADIGFRVVVTSPVLLKPLQLTGLDKVIAMYVSVDAALRGE